MHNERSEIDRRLRAVAAEQRTLMPRWRELLERVLSGDEPLTVPQKAQLLGVPSRRQLFRIGGLSIAGAAVLAACGDDDDAAPEEPEGAPSEDDTDTETTDRSEEMDLVLANTALSLEVLAVDTYQFVIESGMVETAALAEAAALFQSHHAEHREALIAIVQATGAEPFTTANPVVKAAFVDPMIYAAAGEGDLVRLAYDLEQAAAQTYVYAATALSTPDLRTTAMTIGGVESRHATILDLVGELGSEKPATYPTTNPLPEDALVTG